MQLIPKARGRRGRHKALILKKELSSSLSATPDLDCLHNLAPPMHIHLQTPNFLPKQKGQLSNVLMTQKNLDL